MAKQNQGLGVFLGERLKQLPSKKTLKRGLKQQPPFNGILALKRGLKNNPLFM
jgi:hypothetical protein